MGTATEKRNIGTTQVVTAGLSDQEMSELRWAHKHLEHPSLAARMSSLLASSLEEAITLLPKNWRKRMDRAAAATIYQSLKLALSSMEQLDTPSTYRDAGTRSNAGAVAGAYRDAGTRSNAGAVAGSTSNWLHRALVTGTGAVGGFFGPLMLLAELPLTTTLILRSIAEIARSEGEDLSRKDARIACVQVFALGGRTRDDEAADMGYYALRFTLGLHFERDILEYAANAQGPHVPAVIDFIRAVATRFGVVITDKTAAQMVPIAGAVSGAMLNLIFIRHFQDVAKGHFIVRRLERKYGNRKIRDEYQRLMDEEAEAEKEFNPVEGW